MLQKGFFYYITERRRFQLIRGNFQFIWLEYNYSGENCYIIQRYVDLCQKIVILTKGKIRQMYCLSRKKIV